MLIETVALVKKDLLSKTLNGTFVRRQIPS